jgi:transposase-like protein
MKLACAFVKHRGCDHRFDRQKETDRAENKTGCSNAIEGFWSLLRSWLRPHRGISQELLPCYLDFFEFISNVRKRGKAVLGSLLTLLLT